MTAGREESPYEPMGRKAMTAGNEFIVLFVELILGFQIMYYFNSVLGRSARRRKKWIYFAVYGVLGYLYLSLPDSFVVSSLLVLSASSVCL
ncbi:hypothetical protein MHH28_30510 [Paenibacillus sp. FSL K6-1217]|uniref:hypothetical protein n=1 Tax=Paenibacillus sp. FSL K6-1217 TaxID=2921466 RepID=UPI0032517017